MQLRGYQRDAVDTIITALRRSTDPIMIEAATGAGKSLIVAAVAAAIHDMTGKRILCIAPSAELVVQNRAKYLATGNPASMFSASAGAKSLRHPVIFGTPGTVKNRISAFLANFAMVVVDECDLLTPTLRAIIDAMREAQPNLRVVGLTATPYRMGSGYIFRQWPDGRTNGEDKAREPYFAKCVYRIEARALIDAGFLTPPVVGQINAGGYDTHALVPNNRGTFSATAVDQAYHGHGRKTAAIVGDIVAQSQGRQGVLIYAATIQHAEEVLASLPPDLSAMVASTLGNVKEVLARLRARAIKYVVNVGQLTVGVDVPHIDTIAVLRKTESIRLLQQIIGRGLRLSEGKAECLYLDYTTNMEDHCPDGDLFSPDVRAKGAKERGDGIEVECPDCGYGNQFSVHPDRTGFAYNKHGYAMDVFGGEVIPPLPVHYGRRCFGVSVAGERCVYRWAGKECPACGEMNDIAARYCYLKDCRAEIVDPGEKLIADFKAMKRDPTLPQTDMVVSVEYKDGVSRSGNATVRADWKTPWRSFSTWQSKTPRGQRDYDKFMAATNDATTAPQTISYVKDTASGFFRILAYGRDPDHDPSQ